jgi:predicted XRE-type DNA-binding protein
VSKAALARQISATIGERGLTTAEAAGKLGVDEQKLAAVLDGRVTGFTVARLSEFLKLLSSDVDVTVPVHVATTRRRRTTTARQSAKPRSGLGRLAGFFVETLEAIGDLF